MSLFPMTFLSLLWISSSSHMPKYMSVVKTWSPGQIGEAGIQNSEEVEEGLEIMAPYLRVIQ